MEIALKRIGRIAMLAALSDDKEEKEIKSRLKRELSGYSLAVTVVSGFTHEISSTFIKSLVGCALQNNLIEKRSDTIHALGHAGLEALSGIIRDVPSDSSLKLKVAIVVDEKWIAVAIYGDSAYYPLSNHERAGLGVMHL